MRRVNCVDARAAIACYSGGELVERNIEMWKSSTHAKAGTPFFSRYCATDIESVSYTRGDGL